MPEAKLSNRAQEIPASPIRKLAHLANKARNSGIHVYHLNIGQPDIESPQEFLDGLRQFKNKVVAYGGRIKMGDLILVMYLDAMETAEVSYDSLNIPLEVIAEADQIIASFALTSRETPQLEFNP